MIRIARGVVSDPDRPREDAFILIHVDSPQPEDVVVPGCSLRGSGWVIAEWEVTEITLYWGDEFLGYASYGESSPDIAERFPHFPQAAACGFSFDLRLRADKSGGSPSWLFFQVRTEKGGVARKGVPLISVDLTGQPIRMAAIDRSQSTPESISMGVDHAQIDASELLRVSGWVTSGSFLAKLEIHLGATLLEAPEIEVGREKSSAARFKLVQHIAGLKTEHPVMRVRATLAGGETRQIIVPVTLPEDQFRVVESQAGIYACVDEVLARPNGALFAAGWALSEAGITEIGVELDGIPVGVADLGGARPDVGNRYPRIAGARHAGFRFRRAAGSEFVGDHLLSLRIRDGVGNERLISVPVDIDTAASEPKAIASHLGSGGNIRLHIDAPALDSNLARESICGALTVAGWTLSPNGVDCIEVFLEDRRLGTAYYGVRREDIAAMFPGVPDALRCGFAYTIAHHLLGTGDREVRLVVRDRAGQLIEREFSIAVGESNEAIATTQLRTTVGPAEVARLYERLGNRRPEFMIFIRCASDGEADLARLDHTLASLRRQVYGDWYALLLPASDYASNNHSAPTRARAESGEGRVRLVDPEALLDVFEAHRTESPRFFASLRAGDALGVNALLEIAARSEMDPDTDLFFCDERRRRSDLDAVAAYFKPGWSPELLQSTNYIGRSWFAAESMLQSLGMRCRDVAGESDFELALRVTRGARSIRHVPRVLLDTSMGGADSEAVDLGGLERALNHHRIDADIAPGLVSRTWRVKRRLPGNPRVSLIIPTCAARGLIRKCIETIRSQTLYQNYELIVLDNIPDALSEERQWIRERVDKVLRIDEPFNWSRFNNLGVAEAAGEYFIFLNDDIEVLEGQWLGSLLERGANPDVGVVGARLVYPDGKVQHAGMFLSDSRALHAFRFAQGDDQGYFGLALTERNVISVTGACMFSSRIAYERIGGFDEAHPVVNNDLDFCLRVWRAGLRVVYTPFVTLMHHELASRAGMSDVYDAPGFAQEWRHVFLKGDPFHNPNLAVDAVDQAVESEIVEVLSAGHPLFAGAKVQRILAVKLDHIGDFVTAFPAFRRLKRRFPGARLTVLAARTSTVLAAMEPAIDEVIEFDFFHARSGLGRRHSSEDEFADLRANLEGRRFDLAVDLRMHPDTRPILRTSGAPVLAGFDQAGRFPWLNVALEWEGDQSLMPKRANVVDRLCQLVEALGIASEQNAPEAKRLPREKAWELLRMNKSIIQMPKECFSAPLIVIHPAVGNDTRQWPEEHFAGLIDLLTERKDVRIMLVGGVEEQPLANRVLEGVRNRSAVHSLLGDLTLRELQLLLQMADLFVGNNSGPKHIAAALGTPTIGIHSGVVDAREWGPFGRRAVAIRRQAICSPCYVAAASDCHRGLACLSKLRPRDVYELCRVLLM
jgi:ADP-heptose:LPS heptosyltransferase/GT2 family glycosyltransferase